MKLLLKIITIAIIGVGTLLFTYNCSDDAKNNALDNSVYLADVTTVNIKRITADDVNETTFPVQVRMAKEADAETRVSLGVSEKVLNAYNEKNATAYVMLPAEFYEISNPVAVIAQGSSIASAVGLIIKPLSAELGKSGLTYAVPVTIQSVTGSNVSVLNSSDYFIYLVAPTPIADVPVFSRGHGMKIWLKDGTVTVNNFTVEFLVNIDNLGLNYNNQIMFNGASVGDAGLIFSRFAASGAAGLWDKFSVKLGSNNEYAAKFSFQNNKWYHIAFVHARGTLSLYVNGVLDSKYFTEGLSYTMDSNSSRGIRFYDEEDAGTSFARSNVQAAEIRFWSIERTEAQIRDNMYGIAPNTPGLVGYWKCNEGSGNTIADATGNENNAEILGSGTTVWKLNQKIEVGK